MQIAKKIRLCLNKEQKELFRQFAVLQDGLGMNHLLIELLDMEKMVAIPLYNKRLLILDKYLVERRSLNGEL